MSKDEKFLTIIGWAYVGIGAAATTILAMLTVMFLTDDDRDAFDIAYGCVAGLGTLWAACGTLWAASCAMPRNRKNSVRRGGKRKHKKCKVKSGNPSIATAEAGYGAVKQAEREAALCFNNSWFYGRR